MSDGQWDVLNIQKENILEVHTANVLFLPARQLI
jgi:hypothetical protein